MSEDLTFEPRVARGAVQFPDAERAYNDGRRVTAEIAKAYAQLVRAESRYRAAFQTLADNRHEAAGDIFDAQKRMNDAVRRLIEGGE